MIPSKNDLTLPLDHQGVLLNSFYGHASTSMQKLMDFVYTYKIIKRSNQLSNKSSGSTSYNIFIYSNGLDLHALD